MFHSTKVSLAWQAALESTRRIIPFPGLTHASSTPEECAAIRAVGANKIKTATATKARQARPARRRKAIFMQISSLRREAAPQVSQNKAANVASGLGLSRRMK